MDKQRFDLEDIPSHSLIIRKLSIPSGSSLLELI